MPASLEQGFIMYGAWATTGPKILWPGWMSAGMEGLAGSMGL
jgi:hypothetical protein